MGRRARAWILTACSLTACSLMSLFMAAAPAHAQDLKNWPSRQIRLVVPFPPGGPNDIIGRVVGQKMQELLGQLIIIDNRPGAGGNVGGCIWLSGGHVAHDRSARGVSGLSTVADARPPIRWGGACPPYRVPDGQLGQPKVIRRPTLRDR